jgi:hypothetical protein
VERFVLCRAAGASSSPTLCRERIGVCDDFQQAACSEESPSMCVYLFVRAFGPSSSRFFYNNRLP